MAAQALEIFETHSAEEYRVVVNEQVMLMTSSAKDNVFRILVSFYPPLVDFIDQPPAANKYTLQNKVNILILKAINKEGRKFRACLAIDINNKHKLDFNSTQA